MDQHFLGVESSLDSQLNSSIQQQQQQQQHQHQHPHPHQQQQSHIAHLQTAASVPTQPRLISSSNQHKLSGDTGDFDLSNPANPAIATAQALLQNSDQRYQQNSQQLSQQQQQQQQHTQPQVHMPLHHSYQMHPTTHHLQQVSLQSHSANQGYNSPLNHHHVQPISQTPQQSHTQQYPLEVRFDDLGDDREHVVGNDNEFSEKRLVTPIPPLHIQQQIVNSSSTDSNTSPLIKSETGNTVAAPTTASTNTEAADQMLRSFCSRCKKEFDQPIIIPQSNEKVSGQTKFLAEPKIFKLCQHCRDLQRQRSRRWQKKTKDKQGTCRRCGSDIPLNEQKFVLCPSCRQNLRTRKANRAAQGKCVHCSGPLDASIITGEDKKLAANGKGKERSKAGSYKVCQRCRENDKIRRTNLEKMGNCNRCAKVLDASDIGKHKVCANCRNRKKKLTQNLGGVGNSDLDIRLSVSNGGSDHNSSMMGSLPNSNLVPQQMGMMASDQQAAIAMLSAGASAVSQYPPISMTQHLAPQQYSQAQYNQAVAQQQAFNQAIVQAQVQQQQAQAMNINTQQSPKQYAPVQQTRNTLDEFQNSYPTVNPHQ